ncbi:hypothetical protein CQ010_01345 [Arthrobacter sp. MYb211]|nr:hypothetical protein CQ015_03600 [Arthrobacter sp. MYb221]PRC10516.1 hypothetical protein CQ010_01345 [Arthrobacter sp. MYb211]
MGDVLSDVASADKAWRAAKARVERLAVLREVAVREALDAGESATGLGEVLGVSRQRIYKMCEPKW